MRRTRLSPSYTKVCSHCGVNLHTKKEYEDGRCDRCEEAYEEERYAIYGDEMKTKMNEEEATRRERFTDILDRGLEVSFAFLGIEFDCDIKKNWSSSNKNWILKEDT